MGQKLTLKSEQEPNFPFYWIINKRNLKELRKKKKKSLMMKLKQKKKQKQNLKLNKLNQVMI